MNIEITDSTSAEIIQILTNYPQGKLVIKQDRIFWDSLSYQPVQRPVGATPRPNSGQPPKGNNVAAGFERMADTLGRMVC